MTLEAGEAVTRFRTDYTHFVKLHGMRRSY